MLAADKKNLLGVLWVVIAASCFSVQGIVAKLAYTQGVTIPEILVVRKLFCLPILWLIAIKFSPPGKLFSGWKNITFCMLSGLLGYYFTPFLSFTALTMLGAGIERVLLYIYPVFVIFISAFISRKLPSRLHLIVLVFIQIGIALLIGLGSHINIFMLNLKGSLLIILCAFSWAIFVVITQPLTRKNGTLPFIAWGVTGATVGVFLHFSITSTTADYHFDLTSLSIIAFISLITFLPSYFFSEGIKIIGAAHASLITTLAPLGTVLFSYLLLGETMTVLQIIGAFIIVLAIISLENRVLRRLIKSYVKTA